MNYKFKNIETMKKTLILIFAFCLLLFALPSVYSQFTSIPVRLVNSSGDPLTGQALLIKFTKYPHSYPGDIIGAITVTEIGTAGNYIAKGFTVLQFAKLWVNGVNQLWFDSVLTGNIFTYLPANYTTLSSAQTITGNKTLSGTNIFSGTNAFTGSGTNIRFPFLDVASAWYTDYSLLYSNSIGWKGLNDSLYFPREWGFYYSPDNKLYFNTTGNLNSFRIAKRGGGQLFDFNTSQFTWSGSTGLNLNSAVLNQDSIASKRYTNFKDSTWVVLGENVSKYRMITLKKPFWNNPLVFPDWKWYYKSVSETGSTLSVDSFYVMNHSAMVTDEAIPFEVFGEDNWNTCDTVVLPARGLYLVTYDCNLMFPYSELFGITARDSVEFRLVAAPGTENETVVPGSHSEIWKDFNSADKYFPESSPLSRSFTYFFDQLQPLQSGIFYLQIRADLNSALINAAAAKFQITYLLVR